MIALLEGRVAEKSGDRIVLSVNGVGYEVFVPVSTLARLPAPGKTACLFTRLIVRDDSLTLFGFTSTDERGLFDHLLTVTGVGPKVAVAVLSVLAPDSFRRAVATGDVAALTLVPGVGKKVAGRIVLDLKDKVGAGGDGQLTGALSEAREALLALGLSAQEAREALASLAPDGDRPVEELLRDALRNVGR